MSIEILSDAMRRIVTAQQDAEELGSGFGGPHGPAEGPVWWREGGYLLLPVVFRASATSDHDAARGGSPELDVDGMTESGERVPVLRQGAWQI